MVLGTAKLNILRGVRNKFSLDVWKWKFTQIKYKQEILIILIIYPKSGRNYTPCLFIYNK